MAGMNSKTAGIITAIWSILFPALASFAQTEQQGQEPSKAESKPEPSPARRLSSRPAGERRNHFGFSLGILGLYDSNMLGGTPKEGLVAVTPNPTVFVNLGTRKSIFHLDYQFLYRIYLKRRDLDSKNHQGDLEYIYRPTKRATFSIRDFARSGPNDILAFTDQGAIMPSTGQQQVFFDRQRMWFNNLSASLIYQARSKHRIQIRADSQIYHYYSRSDQNTDSVGALISDEYRFSKRWSVLGEASNEWINSDTRSRNGRILRFMGGLLYRPANNWEITARAGDERMSYESRSFNQATYDASISRITKLNRLDIRYNRRYGYQIGLTGFNRYDGVTGYFDQQLSSRLSMSLLSRFYRTRTDSFGTVDTLGGGAGLDYAILPSLAASVFGHYIYQKSGSPLFIQDIKTDRYMVYVGLYYLFPSAKRERRSNTRF